MGCPHVLAECLARGLVLGLGRAPRAGSCSGEEGEGRLYVLAVLGEVEMHAPDDVPGRVQALKQVLCVAKQMKLLTLGTVALDGTKIHANASRHSALSYGHTEKIEAQVQVDVAELLACAEAADAAGRPP